MKILLKIPRLLPAYSLVLLPFFVVPRGVTINFGGVVYLLLINVGLVAWIFIHRARSVGYSRLGLAVVALSYAFIVTQISALSSGVGIFLAISLTIVAVFFVRMSTDGDALVLTPIDKRILVIIAIAALSIVVGSQRGSWDFGLYVLCAGILYISFGRLATVQNGARTVVLLTRVAAAGLLLTGAFGLWRVVDAGLDYNQAVEAFRDKDYSNVVMSAERLNRGHKTLQYDRWSPTSLVNELRAFEDEPVKHSTGSVVIGDVAMLAGLWREAAVEYRAVLAEGPILPRIKSKLGNALFELGHRNKALDIFRGEIADRSNIAENHLAQGIALTKMASWPEANASFSMAFENTGLWSDLNGYFPRSGQAESKMLKDICPPSFVPYLERLSHFDIVRLLEDTGFKVYYPSMEIGSTGVTTPVDIVAMSGAGRSIALESLMVNGQEVSKHGRGYNIAIIDPATGVIDSVVAYDTWRDHWGGNLLANDMYGLPDGKIIAGVVRDDGASWLHPRGQDALRFLGVVDLPEAWWSHALIGLTGAQSGSVVSALGDNAATVVGVLKGNVYTSNWSDIEEVLQEGAVMAPEGIAIYVPDWTIDTEITVVHR